MNHKKKSHNSCINKSSNNKKSNSKSNSDSNSKTRIINNDTDAPTSTSSVLSKLAILRELFSSSPFTESQLSQCLRNCGYNVDRAATELLSFVSTTNDTSMTTPISAIKDTSDTHVHTHTDTHSSSTPQQVTRTHATTTVLAPPTQKALSSPPSISSSSPPKVLLLCQRWMVGCCTHRHSSIHYLEPMSFTVSSSPFLRFQGKNLQGTLDLRSFHSTFPSQTKVLPSPPKKKKNGKTFLIRCLQDSILRIEGEALMEDSTLTMGSDVPLQIRLYILQPHRFFSFFTREKNCIPRHDKEEKQQQEEEEANQESAFQFLQWAQYGICDSQDWKPSSHLHLHSKSISHGNSKTCKEEGTNSVVHDQDAQEEGDDMEMDQEVQEEGEEKQHLLLLQEEEMNMDEKEIHLENVQQNHTYHTFLNSFTSILPTHMSLHNHDNNCNINCTPSNGIPAIPTMPQTFDPIMLTEKKVVLLPYQRDALYWMMSREQWQNNCEIHTNTGNMKKALHNENKHDSDSSIHHMNSRDLILFQELMTCTYGSLMTKTTVTTRSHTQGVSCDLGPVQVTESSFAQGHVTTLNGIIDPGMYSPLWEKRYLWDKTDGKVYTFYVNSWTRTASLLPPEPPRQALGGILADEMGLGKSVMILALISKVKELEETSLEEGQPRDLGHASWSKKRKMDTRENVTPRTTLIVCPLSMLSQWNHEISSKTSLKCLIYYDDGRKSLRSHDFQEFDIVVTTYGTLQSEYAPYVPSRAGSDRLSDKVAILSFHWKRVILDEAHLIKNVNTIIGKASCALRSDNRWCVTGTPLQNSFQDVYALLKFLRHEPWCEYRVWKKVCDHVTPSKRSSSEPLKNVPTESHAQDDSMKIILARIRGILSTVMLRRTKESLGNLLPALPTVQSKTVFVTLSGEERVFYDALSNKSKSIFQQLLNAGVATKSWLQIFSLLQRLRQACDHVALIGVTSNIISCESSRDVPPKPYDIDEGFEVDKDSDYPVIQLWNFFSSHHHYETFSCLGVSKEKTFSSDLTFSHSQNNLVLKDECAICLETPRLDNSFFTPCAHIFCRCCLISALNSGKNKTGDQKIYTFKIEDSQIVCSEGPCPYCQSIIIPSDIVVFSKSSKSKLSCDRLSAYKITQTGCDEMNKLHPVSTHKIIAKKEDSDIYSSLLDSLSKRLISAKLGAILTELDDIWKESPNCKILIFSQFLGFLDIIQRSLENRNITNFRLDGKMTMKERATAIDNFNTSSGNRFCDMDEVTDRGSILLISMKAGGVGLNLVSASCVFIADPWWHSAMEEQCVNRINRLGQSAKVIFVRKFIVSESVEEKMLLLQNQKKSIASEVLANEKFSSGAIRNVPTMDDFKVLFGLS